MKLGLRVALASTAMLAIPAQATVVVSASGSLDSGDATELGRVVRDGTASTWASQKAYPGSINVSTSYSYDLINATFAANALQDVYYEIAFTQLTGTDGTVFSVAYLNAFNPNSLGTNYLADAGSSPTNGTTGLYQVVVPAGGQLLVHFLDTSTNAATYSYTISAFSDANRGEAFPGSVPEPSSWAMLLMGFVGIGFAVRNSPQKKVPAPRTA